MQEEKDKPQNLLLIRKFVRKMKESKRRIFNGQIFEKQQILGFRERRKNFYE